ncbi:GAF domain-containing protein [Pseudarthrobacter scleromae]|uniref:GAF domain-containing protein n=1 Tax=Pseudarthrobacter scleromae TaxID=158897 RepID=UPI003642EF90
MDAIDKEVKRRLELAATIGLDPQKLWPSYFGRSHCSAFELDAYLHEALALPAIERGPDAVKELKAGQRRFRSVKPESGGPGHPPEGQKPGKEDALAALGAAGKSLLSPERAEAERLKSLHETDLLYTGPEEVYDRVVAAAWKFFGVGAASLSLIAEDAQFFKSAVGPLREEAPRVIALCTETVERNSMLVINDTLADDRFASNPLVTGEPYIRFYAGYPLHGPRGWNIGTLCVIDQQPRTFSPSDQQVLRTLAAVVQEDIDART